MSTIGNLYTVSAPSGAGKTSLVSGLLKHDRQARVSVSHTTRAQRPGEHNGKDYHFVDEPGFQTLLEQQQMLEHACVFGHWYGTSRAWVEEQLALGLDVILEIDWQGRDQVLAQRPATTTITILPPSQQILQQRLRQRGTDTDAVIARRMREASQEIQQGSNSHYLIVNDDYDRALAELCSIFSAQRLKTATQKQKHATLLASLLSNPW